MTAFTPPAQIPAATKALSSHINDLTTACTAAFADVPSSTDINNGTTNYAVSTGSANAYLVTLPYTLSVYTDGMAVNFKANHSNTGAATINVNSLGVKSIRRQNGDALVAGDILINKIYPCRYNATSGYVEYQLVSAGEMADITAVAAIAEDVAEVADIVADVTTVAGIAADVSAAPTHAANAAASELAAAASESAASDSESAAAASATTALNAPRFKKLLVNGGMDIWPYGPSTLTYTQGQYVVGNWYILSDGNNRVTVGQGLVAGHDWIKRIALTVATGNLKFGVAQIIENANLANVDASVASLSFKAFTSLGTIGTIKAAVLSWTGTVDAPTKSMVSAWGADGVTPTWAANWTLEGVGTFTPTTVEQTFELENISIDTNNLQNIAVFIWNDDKTTTAGDILYIDDVQLEAGTVATAFEQTPYALTYALCEYYQKTIRAGWSWYNSSHPVTNRIYVPFGVMRAAPTATLTAITQSGVTGGTVNTVGAYYIEVEATSSSTGQAVARYSIALDATLGI